MTDTLKDDILELEELVSIAAEKAPISDPAVLAIRAAYKAVKSEFAGVVDPEKEAVRKLGGLYVVGTERHESSRIDNQLRGRSGRQGDPGASRFFLSLDDKTLRTCGVWGGGGIDHRQPWPTADHDQHHEAQRPSPAPSSPSLRPRRFACVPANSPPQNPTHPRTTPGTFGADRLKGIMDSFRVSDDMPLEAKMVTDAIDKVQGKVEEYYSEIREQVFTFDEVLSTQRDNIYSRRGTLLDATDDDM